MAKSLATEGKSALEYAGLALRGESRRNDDVLGLALDRQLTGGFIAVVAQRLDAAGLKTRRRERRDVEPNLAGHFLIALGGSGINARQVNIHGGFGRFRALGSKLNCAVKRLNFPSMVTPICW